MNEDMPKVTNTIYLREKNHRHIAMVAEDNSVQIMFHRTRKDGEDIKALSERDIRMKRTFLKRRKYKVSFCGFRITQERFVNLFELVIRVFLTVGISATQLKNRIDEIAALRNQGK